MTHEGQNSEEQKRFVSIIHLPHHTSRTRPQMSMSDRAAQFSPFASLKGYGSSLREEARITDGKVVLSESVSEELNRSIAEVAERLPTPTLVSVTYFQPDATKEGGTYITEEVFVKKIDPSAKVLQTDTKRQIELDNIIVLEMIEDNSL